jgi:hypothetical protein
MPLHDADERREVTYREARAVLEAQRETLADMDTKAVRTVRITVVLAGVVFSVGRLELGLFDPLFATFSAIAFLGSLATGLYTYSQADLFLGPNKAYIEQLTDGDFENSSWREDLLYTFGAWIEENRAEIGFYGRLLSLSQSLLVVGVVSLGVAVVL